VEEVFADYASALQRLDAEAFADFYNIPSIVIRPSGEVDVLCDATTRATLVSSVIEDARRDNYLRTDFPVLEIRSLGSDLTLLSGVAVRIDRNEVETRRFGFVYTMRFDGEHWKLVTLVTYPAAEPMDETP
jgi:hypothetical protein